MKLKQPAKTNESESVVILKSTTSADESFQVKIEFEGEVYEATCLMMKLNAPDCRMCQIQFNQEFPQNVGIYRSENENQMLDDAKIRFRSILQDLSDSKRLHKKIILK